MIRAKMKLTAAAVAVVTVLAWPGGGIVAAQDKKGEPGETGKIEKLAVRAFNALSHKDYAKFDIRVDSTTNIPYFTDSNPNTAFGPDKGLPFTEILGLHGVSFEDALISLLTKYGKNIQ